MKRFISLLIALVLLVSMFALPTFALAEETTQTPDEPEVEAKRNVGFNPDAFAKYVVEHNKGLYVEMSDNFKLNLSWTVPVGEGDDATEEEYEWLKDVDAVKELFPNIKYIVLPDEDLPPSNTDHNKTNIVYKSTDPVTGETTEKKGEEGVLEFKHVTLQSETFFTAAEGYKFVGWRMPCTYDGKLLKDENGDLLTDVEKYNLYRAGDKFSMPYVDYDEENDTNGVLEIVAQWQEVKEGEEAEKIEYTYPKSDIVCLEYCRPSDDPRDENWERVRADSTITL